MKKMKTAATKQIKTEPKIDPKIKTLQTGCELFILTHENWNVQQDDRANIMNADFHQMDSARTSKRYE